MRYTTKIFKRLAREKHGDKFDYSQTVYKTRDNPVRIICHETDEDGTEHGIFAIMPRQHIKFKYGGCIGCSQGTANRHDTAEWIESAKRIHGDLYDYSKSRYKGTHRNIKIICHETDEDDEHGVFKQKAYLHLQGHGCPKCGGTTRLTIKEWIVKAIETHGELYDYTHSTYKNNRTPVEIKCRIHGNITVNPKSHLTGTGCAKCAKNHPYTTEEWIERANVKHDGKYDYSQVVYKNSETMVIIICTEKFDDDSIHGEFQQLPSTHLYGSGCPRCVSSRYSKVAMQWLKFCELDRKIQHAHNGKEFQIPETKFFADGYCREYNEIYEFYGDYFHGNLKVYNPNSINPTKNKTFQEIYQKTLDREEEIVGLGYKLIVMWERDWRRGIWALKQIQRNWKKKRRYEVSR